MVMALAWETGVRSDIPALIKIEQECEQNDTTPPLPDFYAYWTLAKELTGGDMFRLTQLPCEEPYISWLMYFAGACREAQSTAQNLWDKKNLEDARSGQK